MHAEATCEPLEPGDEVKLTGKLQRGQVVCFKVHVKQSALAGVAQDERTDEDPSLGCPTIFRTLLEALRSDRFPTSGRYPRSLQQPWEKTPGNHD